MSARVPLLATAMALGMAAVQPAAAAIVFTSFSHTLWGASEATLGISGYTIENFEDTALAPGLYVARPLGTAGTFAATSTLPASSLFDPTTDPSTVGVKAFLQGVWDGSRVIVNHPGPGVSGGANWYNDSSNFRDLEFTFDPGTVSVGFSVQQLEQNGNRVLVNGVEVISNLFTTMGNGTDTSQAFPFASRNGYIRFDATGGDTITSIRIANNLGAGFAIDHLAFNVVATPEPGAIGLFGLGLTLLAARRRR
jgi:hypothetical protein